MKDRLLTLSEAAERLGVSKQTLRRWDASGRLKAIRSGNRRRYHEKNLSAVSGFVPSPFRLAKRWVSRDQPFRLPEKWYCPNSGIFQARLHALETELVCRPGRADFFPLIVAVAGEIGNNSFDHNLGNWLDEPGVFFSCDLDSGTIVLADRGQGVLTTLKRALPSLSNDWEALEAAFSRVISGRAPEPRGNGLKFVREVVTHHPIRLLFQSGSTSLRLKKGDQTLPISHSRAIQGCLAKLSF